MKKLREFFRTLVGPPRLLIGMFVGTFSGYTSHATSEGLPLLARIAIGLGAVGLCLSAGMLLGAFLERRRATKAIAFLHGALETVATGRGRVEVAWCEECKSHHPRLLVREVPHDVH